MGAGGTGVGVQPQGDRTKGLIPKGLLQVERGQPGKGEGDGVFGEDPLADVDGLRGEVVVDAVPAQYRHPDDGAEGQDVHPGARQPLGEGGAKGEGAAGQGDDEEEEEAAHVLKDGDGVGMVFQIAPPLPPARPPLPSPGAGERRLASMAALAEGMLQT